jgi:hypothetical protein
MGRKGSYFVKVLVTGAGLPEKGISGRWAAQIGGLFFNWAGV